MNTLVGASTARLAPPEIETDPRRVLAVHKRVDGKCSGCGYVGTQSQPLCAVATRALRVLADRGMRPPHVRALTNHSDEELLRLADQHGGDHRCRRCGFAYSKTVRSCPAYRRIRDVLEARGLMQLTPATSSDRGLCASKGTGWAVDGIDIDSWRMAVDTCAQCPLLARCQEQLNALLDRGERPREQIVAALLFTTTGQVIDRASLDRYAVNRGRSTRTHPAATMTRQAPVVSAVEMLEVAA